MQGLLDYNLHIYVICVCVDAMNKMYMGISQENLSEFSHQTKLLEENTRHFRELSLSLMTFKNHSCKHFQPLQHCLCSFVFYHFYAVSCSILSCCVFGTLSILPVFQYHTMSLLISVFNICHWLSSTETCFKKIKG